MPEAKNYLHANKVDRVAVVPKGAVPDAEIVVFKSKKKDVAESGATEYKEMPVADIGREWKPEVAVANVLKWAAGPGKEPVDFTKVREAFMWVDPKNAEDITGYRFLKADVIDGELTAIPRAVVGIVGVMADKGIDIPKEDKIEVLKHCKEIYNKMDTEFPEIAVKVFEKGTMEMGFMRGFIVRGTQAAVYSLEDIVWDTMYGYAKEEQMVAAFADFKKVINDVLAKLVTKTKAEDTNKLTQEDVVKAFVRGLKISVVAEGFEYFSSHLVWLMVGQDDMEEPEKTINAVIEIFEKFVTENVKEIVSSKARKGDGTEPIEKIGRKISAARLSQIKDAVVALNLVLEEAESQTSKSQEDEVMDQEKFDALSVTVDSIVTAMKEDGKLLTEDERVIFDKAKVDAQAKADLSARAVVVGLKEDATEADIIAKEAEVQKTTDKAKKDAQDVVDKEKTEADARLKAQDEKIETMGKTIDAIADKVGVKTSIEADPNATDKNKTKGDPFGDVCKGKGLKKETEKETE